jgi:hypothetical protein
MPESYPLSQLSSPRGLRIAPFHAGPGAPGDVAAPSLGWVPTPDRFGGPSLNRSKDQARIASLVLPRARSLHTRGHRTHTRSRASPMPPGRRARPRHHHQHPPRHPLETRHHRGHRRCLAADRSDHQRPGRPPVPRQRRAGERTRRYSRDDRERQCLTLCRRRAGPRRQHEVPQLVSSIEARARGITLVTGQDGDRSLIQPAQEGVDLLVVSS